MWPDNYDRDDLIPKGGKVYRKERNQTMQTMRDDIKRWLPKGTEIKEVKFGDTAAYREAMSGTIEEPKHPDYYKGTNDGGRSIEVFDIIDQFVDGDFYLGNVLKYVCRAGKKSKETKRQDLEKALHYIKEAIKRCGEQFGEYGEQEGK